MWSALEQMIYDWVQNFKESMNLGRVYLCLDYSTCYFQNGLGHQGEGQVTCFKSDYLFTIGCKISRKVWIWRGLPHIMSTALAIAIMGIIAKNGICKTSQKYNVWYVTRTGFSCRIRIWSQNSKIPSASNVIAWFVLSRNMKYWFSCNKWFNCWNH